MIRRIQITVLVTSIFLLSACAAKKVYIKESSKSSLAQNRLQKENVDYEIYLVGDIGADNSQVTDSDIVDLIKSQLKPNSKTQSVVFLGNNFTNDGFPDTESPDFVAVDNAITACLQKLKDNTDKVYFIPGNSEWYDGENYSNSSLMLVEDYVQSKTNDKNVFVPSNGCGEPKVVELTDDLIIVLMDSEWVLLGDNSDQRKRSGCDIDDELELVTYLNEIMAKNKNKNVIIAAHHPIYSNGRTGGNYGAASHILPLPILGSFITGVKKLGGGQQRFGHPQYEAYRAAMNLVLSNFEGVIHVSGHDHNLQYHEKDNNHFVVSGSGAITDFVRKGGDAEFAFMSKGFSKITHTKDLELWLEFYVPDPDNPGKAKSIYRKRLYKKEIIDFSDKEIYKDADEYPETVRTVASNTYTHSKFGLGETYRAEWATEIEAPILLLDEYAGGLTPVQQGGGFQTRSLRLENPDGMQWVVRTIDKDVTKVVPPALRQTFVKSLVQDGISAAHPYAALAIPKLADAAQIYHANPKVVWQYERSCRLWRSL